MREPDKNFVHYSLTDGQYQLQTLRVPKTLSGSRLDVALQRLMPDYSRNRLQSWIRAGQVDVNGNPAKISDKVWQEDVIQVRPLPLPEQTAFAPEDLPLDIVHEDPCFFVVNKRAGLVVHPGSGNWEGTLLNALLHHDPHLLTLPRAGIVHRLDKDTSGLMIVARTLHAQTNLTRQIGLRQVSREYLALVEGSPHKEGEVDAPIGRHPVHRTKMAVLKEGRPSKTFYEVMAFFPDCALLRCKLDTGRTHQIRVHMQSIGHPLVGDQVYGNRHSIYSCFGRQALHAFRLSFSHPVTDERLTFEADLPSDMLAFLTRLEQASHEK
ncbi:MAG: RluA family pseudouridine synthase [Proteobacteria bacterium]|nr:RluA family pseudouridine synthase [Pseudomonadota bacterium]MDE3207325.1 RluA family pseudouridine synthase [Pseudomonadota bacterium]